MIQTISHQFKLNYFNHEKRRPIQHLLTLLAIFGLMQVNISNLFLFVVLVALYTIGMDFVYRACK